MEQEIIELYQAVQNYKNGQGTNLAVILECADVSNHCAMIADKFGLLDVENWEDVKR